VTLRSAQNGGENRRAHDVDFWLLRQGRAGGLRVKRSICDFRVEALPLLMRDHNDAARNLARDSSKRLLCELKRTMARGEIANLETDEIAAPRKRDAVGERKGVSARWSRLPFADVITGDGNVQFETSDAQKANVSVINLRLGFADKYKFRALMYSFVF